MMYLFKMCAGVLEPRILSVERDGGVVYSWRVSSFMCHFNRLLNRSCARRSIHSSQSVASLQHMRARYAVTVDTIHTAVNKQHTC